ncbi:MAG: hypothetical protein MJ171_01695 [Clostridia bacterium]|nr:hypothetical protein [Clostridia bacterium]
MKQYDFHGSIPIDQIGKELRAIAMRRENFKILTGYGSTSGVSRSKDAALKSLKNMRAQGIIKAYLPAEKCTELLSHGDPYLEIKQRYKDVLSQDRDARIGNDGIIFVFVK